MYKRQIKSETYYTDKVDIFFRLKYQNKNLQKCPPNMSFICELHVCDIEDGRHITCGIISKGEVCNLFDIICTER